MNLLESLQLQVSLIWTLYESYLLIDTRSVILNTFSLDWFGTLGNSFVNFMNGLFCIVNISVSLKNVAHLT